MPEGVATGVSQEIHQREGFDPRASTGLFVGVSKFKDPRFAEVPFAVDDAVDLAHLFAVELGLLLPERATLALSGEPKKEASRARLVELLDRGARRVEARQADLYEHLEKSAGASGPEGLFLLTVATHGLTDQGGDFLIARDSLARRRLRTGVAVDELFDDVARAPARRRLVLLDACRERLSEDTRSVGAVAMAKSFADAIARASGQMVLSGATHGGYAYDDTGRGNGVFTAAILDGLRGAAAADTRGWITVRGLADYVQETVSEWVRRHRSDHADVSRGIGRRIEGEAEHLPLAEHRESRQRRERYAAHRESALAKLSGNLGPVLTGGFYDQVAALLPVEFPAAAPEVERLLEEVEALDGTERSQRSLRDFVREHHGEPPSLDAVSLPSVVPVDPASGPVQMPDEPPRRPTRAARTPRKPFLVGVGALLLVLVLFGVWRLLPGGEPLQVDKASERPPPNPSPGELWKSPSGIRFHFVPPGSYKVGSPEDESGRIDREWPRHEVQLTRGVWIGETEVTQGQWKALGLKNPSFFQNCGDDCPVEQVTWSEAVEFANRLSDKEELDRCYELEGCTGTMGEGYTCESATFQGLDCNGYRLPTEMEWEIAARAKTTTPIYTGGFTLKGENHAPELNAIAWYGGNSGVDGKYGGGIDCSSWPKKQYDSQTCGTHPVGRKQGNDWQLYDMLGNVYEWCTDWYGPYDPNVPPIDRTGPVQSTLRVIRGGSWYSNARGVRAACRNRHWPSDRWNALGFRLARGQALRSSEAEPRGR